MINVSDDRKISDIALVHERTAIIFRGLTRIPTCGAERIGVPRPDVDGARAIGRPMGQTLVDTPDRRSLPAV